MNPVRHSAQKLPRRSGLRLAQMLALVAALSIAMPTPSAAQSPSARPASQDRVERPWEMRYFISVTQSWPSAQEFAKRVNSVAGEKSPSWKGIFDPVAFLAVSKPPIPRLANLAVSVIEFHRDGTVTSQNAHPGTLRGGLNRLRYINLATGNDAADPQFALGEWFTGLGDMSVHWAPGLCGTKEMPSPFSKTDEHYLYGPKFLLNEYSATFGCREWAYQLYDDARPYIDVTSYVRIGKSYPKFTFIREFIGWARFGDKKPVIGKHGSQWYCLHDCPDGEKPAPIADIKSWATNKGWKVPSPPTKAPTFPDPPARSGTYLNQ
jgi:hypothetical protein